jgi:hypothetical protein
VFRGSLTDGAFLRHVYWFWIHTMVCPIAFAERVNETGHGDENTENAFAVCLQLFGFVPFAAPTACGTSRLASTTIDPKFVTSLAGIY